MPAIADTISRARKLAWIVLVPLLAACGDGGGVFIGTLPPHPDIALRLEPIAGAPDLGNTPLFLSAPPGDNTRLFVVEKGGMIKIIDMVGVGAPQVLPTPFLNLSTSISTAGEGGLLGLAFHPNFSGNGFFYVNVINLSGDTEIRRYTVSANPNVADTATETLIIRIDQPAATNHKAGWLGFGQDGFLYAALGDGGANSGNGQDLTTLLGKILRLDVSVLPYAIPAGNPFVGMTGEDEIWAYGLRNPWRPSFDRVTGDLYVADVGQGRQEEVNVSTAANGAGRGINYGWDTMEGSLCFNPMAGCVMTGLALPVVEYDHSAGACSITGGYVYRGAAIPALQGTYFYADFCAGFVRSFRLVNGAATEQFEWAALSPGVNITSFGEDAAGELYIMTAGGGLFRIVAN